MDKPTGHPRGPRRVFSSSSLTLKCYRTYKINCKSFFWNIKNIFHLCYKNYFLHMTFNATRRRAMHSFLSWAIHQLVYCLCFVHVHFWFYLWLLYRYFFQRDFHSFHSAEQSFHFMYDLPNDLVETKSREFSWTIRKKSESIFL